MEMGEGNESDCELNHRRKGREAKGRKGEGRSDRGGKRN